ncbi:MAG: TonB-dependent receptor [Pseudomonadota bacterium]
MSGYLAPKIGVAGCVLMLALVQSAVVSAQEASEQDQGATASVPLEQITVEGGQEVDVRDGAADSAATISIGQDDLERSNPLSLEDVFEGEATVQVGGGTAVSQKLYVNGIEDQNLAVTIDGARQNQRIFHHATTNLFDPALFKSVDVYPGPAPADAGPGALGGAIALETVDASDLLDDNDSLGAFATASYGTNGDPFVTGAALYGASGGFDGLGYVRYGEGDNYEDGDGREVLGTAVDLLSFLGKGGFESTDGHRFEASGERVIDDANRPFRANIGQIIGGRPVPLTRGYEVDRETYTARYEQTKAQGLFDPELVLTYTESEVNVPDPFGSEGSAGGWNGKAQNTFRFGRHSVVAGVDFYREDANYEDPETPELTETIENVGLFAQARVEPLEQLALSFGLRSDWQDFEGVDGTDERTSGISGNVFAEYAVTDNVSVQGGYSNVFGGITTAEPYIFNPDWEYSDLDPVRAENISGDVVFNYRGFTASAGLFRTDFDDARNASFGGGPFIPIDFRSEGFRLSAGYSWSDGFVRATFTDADVTLDGSSSDSFSLEDFAIPVGQTIGLEAAHRVDTNFTFGASLEAALEYDDSEGDDLEGEILLAYDDYVVVDVYADMVLPKHQNVSLRLDVENLFDADYSTRATYGQEFESVIPLREPGRSIVLSAKIEF